MTLPFDGATETGALCGFGPVVELDGERYDTSVDGLHGQRGLRRPARPRAVRRRAASRTASSSSTAGTHRLRILSTEEFQPVVVATLADGGRARRRRAARDARGAAPTSRASSASRLGAGRRGDPARRRATTTAAGWPSWTARSCPSSASTAGRRAGGSLRATAGSSSSATRRRSRTSWSCSPGSASRWRSCCWRLVLLLRTRLGTRSACPSCRATLAPPPSAAGRGRSSPSWPRCRPGSLGGVPAAVGPASLGRRLRAARCDAARPVARRRCCSSAGAGRRGRSLQLDARRRPARRRPADRRRLLVAVGSILVPRLGPPGGAVARVTGVAARPRRSTWRCRRCSPSSSSGRCSCAAASRCAATWCSCRTSPGRTPGSAWTGRRRGSCPATPCSRLLDVGASRATWSRRRCSSARWSWPASAPGRLVGRPRHRGPGGGDRRSSSGTRGSSSGCCIGQWGSVVGYAALPWVVLAAVRVRDDVRRGLAGPDAAGWRSRRSGRRPSALVGALTAFCVVVVRRAGEPRSLVTARRSRPGRTCPGWCRRWSAATGSTRRAPSSTAFAARGGVGAGLLPSVASLGGIWKTSVVPGERTVVARRPARACVTASRSLGCWRTRDGLDASARDHAARARRCWRWSSCRSPCCRRSPALTDALDAAAEPVPALSRCSATRTGSWRRRCWCCCPGIAAAVDAALGARRAGARGVRAVAVLLVLLARRCACRRWPGGWAATCGRSSTRRSGSGRGRGRGGPRGARRRDGRAALARQLPGLRLERPPRACSTPRRGSSPGEVLIDDRHLLGDGRHRCSRTRTRGWPTVTAALAADGPRGGAGRARRRPGPGREGQRGPGRRRARRGRSLHDGGELTLVALGDPRRGRRPAEPAAGRGHLVGGPASAVSRHCVVARACALRRRAVW